MTGRTGQPLPYAIVEGIDKLRPLPITTVRLVRALSQTEVSASEVAGIIEHDETVAAEVLRLSSTVAFASRGPTLTVREAVLRIGTERLLNLVLGSHLQELRTGTAATSAREDQLWLHSVASELAVTAIGQANPRMALPRLASTAALLHDIGKLLMLRYLDSAYLDVLAARSAEGGWRLEAEREVFTTTHAEVGAALARRWRFPSELVDAIAGHHAVPADEPDPMVDVVRTASLVAGLVGAAGTTDSVMPVHLGGAVARLGLPRGGFARVCQQTRQQLQVVCHRASLAPPEDPHRLTA